MAILGDGLGIRRSRHCARDRRRCHFDCLVQRPTETNREVIAIRFNQSDQVVSFAQYGLQDGRVIDVNTRKTLVAGEDTSFIKNIFRGIGSSTAGPILGRKL